jgi:tetratricopeptide (TPR) repeat protein
LGDARQAIEFYEQALVIAREIGDKRNEGNHLGNLGNAYAALGDARQAIEFYEQALVIAREIGDKRGEGADLGNLGNAYYSLGDARQAIEFYEQALVIDREIGDKRGESICLENTGHAFLSLEEYPNAEENYKHALQIADEISFPQTQNFARWGMAQAYLFQNDLVNARATIEAALQFDVPGNNHNASALRGIIALRQGERATAQEAFTKSIAQADEILAKTPDYYDALDAKGLALCGLALTPGDSQLKADCHLQAIETFSAARKIEPHAGVVKSVLRLFDELVKCDGEDLLKGVREVIEGTPLVE